MNKFLIINNSDTNKRVTVDFGIDVSLGYKGTGSTLIDDNIFEACLPPPFYPIDLSNPEVDTSDEITFKGDFVFEVYSDGRTADRLIPITVNAADFVDFLNGNEETGLEATLVKKVGDSYTYKLKALNGNTSVYIYSVSSDYILDTVTDLTKGSYYLDEEQAALAFNLKRVPYQLPPEGQLDEVDLKGKDWSLITFDELGTVNPTYSVANSILGRVEVTTGGAFVGQTIKQLSGLDAHSIVGTPTKDQPLELYSNDSYWTVIKDDGANPESPVLAGNIGFDSPVSVLFSKDVHAVGLTGGHFNEIGSTYIEVYDRQGNVLGAALNTMEGIETFGFSTGSVAKIAGLSFYVNSLESAGFAMDNLRFK